MRKAEALCGKGAGGLGPIPAGQDFLGPLQCRRAPTDLHHCAHKIAHHVMQKRVGLEMKLNHRT